MDIEEKWKKSIENIRIYRYYKYPLSTKSPTILPYIFIGPSLINIGDTIVRKGKVRVDKPLILLPSNIPQFLGFELEKELGIDEDAFRFFLMVRGIEFPSLKYKNEISTIDIFEGEAEKAIKYYNELLEKEEDKVTGLIYGTPEYWQFSIILYVSMIIKKSLPNDIERYIEEIRRRFL